MMSSTETYARNEEWYRITSLTSKSARLFEQKIHRAVVQTMFDSKDFNELRTNKKSIADDLGGVSKYREIVDNFAGVLGPAIQVKLGKVDRNTGTQDISLSINHHTLIRFSNIYLPWKCVSSDQTNKYLRFLKDFYNTKSNTITVTLLYSIDDSEISVSVQNVGMLCCEDNWIAKTIAGNPYHNAGAVQECVNYLEGRSQ